MKWLWALFGGFTGGMFLCYKIMAKKRVTYEPNVQTGLIYMVDKVDHLVSIKDILSPTANAFDCPFAICEMIRKVPKDVPIRLVICTRGGKLTNCEKILKQLRKHPAGYISYVKDECFSAGTILSLGAKEIVMTEDSYLGKIDPQIYTGSTVYSAITFHKLFPEHVNAQNVHLVKLSQQAINHIENLLKMMNLDSEVETNIKNQMIYSEFPHNKTFDFQECQKIGLKIRLPNDEEKSILKFSLSS